jgi:hypothetical protein
MSLISMGMLMTPNSAGSLSPHWLTAELVQGLSKVTEQTWNVSHCTLESLRAAAGGEAIPAAAKLEIASGAVRPRNDGLNPTFEKPWELVCHCLPSYGCEAR